MGDRTYLNAQLSYSVPVTDEELKRLTELLDDPDTLDVNDDTIHGYWEGSMGSAGDVLELLIENAAPEVTEITVWEDPKYEFLGMLHNWKREGNRVFVAECDADGNVVLNAGIIEKCIENTDTRQSLIYALRTLTTGSPT